jgi:hypothetical protein
MIINPIISNFKKYNYGFILQWKEEYDYLPYICWSKILCGIFHSNNIKMITNKNLKLMMEWIKKKNTMIKFSNNFYGFFHNGN